MSEVKKPARGWARFSLRSLMVVLTIFSVVFGWHMHRVRIQQDAVAKLADLGVVIHGGLYKPPEPTPGSRDYTKYTNTPLKRLRVALGKDHFAHVHHIWLDVPPGPEHLDGISEQQWFKRVVDQLVRLPKLRKCTVEFRWDHTQKRYHYEQIARLTQISSLYLDNVELRGELLGPLADLSNLTVLLTESPKPYSTGPNTSQSTPNKSAYLVFAKMKGLKTLWVESYTEEQADALGVLRPDISLLQHGDYAP